MTALTEVFTEVFAVTKSFYQPLLNLHTASGASVILLRNNYLTSERIKVNGETWAKLLIDFFTWPLGCPSVVLQLPFGCRSVVLRLPFGCRSVVLRLCFGCPSVVLRLPFGCRSVVLRLSFAMDLWNPRLVWAAEVGSSDAGQRSATRSLHSDHGQSRCEEFILRVCIQQD